MIKEHCFTKDWFQSMSRKYRYNDLGIIEKVVRAYSLLDMLALSGCPYIFKGGTCVGLILGDGNIDPRRHMEYGSSWVRAVTV